MTELTTYEILVKAKAKLERDGIHRGAFLGPGRTTCSMGAIHWVVSGNPNTCDEKSCYEFEAILEITEGMAGAWNDQATNEEIFAAFDRAIETVAPEVPNFGPEVDPSDMILLESGSGTRGQILTTSQVGQ